MASNSPVTPNREDTWFRKNGIALAALLLSCAIAVTNLIVSLRGPDVKPIYPSQILVYRDGPNETAPLAIAARISLLNASADYSDAVTSSSLRLDDQIDFPTQSWIEPTFTGSTDGSAACLPQRRCVPLTSLAVSDLPDQVSIVPAGGVFDRYSSYRLWCQEATAPCARFQTAGSSLAALAGRPLNVVIRVRLHDEGAVTLRCQTARALDATYITRHGWQTLDCVTPSRGT
jgi:hypothetical protein